MAFGCSLKSEETQASCLPRAGGEGGGEGRDEARQEAERVLARGGEVDERQDDASVDNVAQDGSEDVFSQAGDQKNHVLHLHNFTAHQEDDSEGDVPAEQRRSFPASLITHAHPDLIPRALTT